MEKNEAQDFTEILFLVILQWNFT